MKRLLCYLLLLLPWFLAAQSRNFILSNAAGKPQPVSLDADVNVIIFLSPECPLCQSYTLTLNKLKKQYADANVKWIGVVPGSAYSTSEINQFVKEYRLSMPVYADPNKSVVQFTEATITPEVFVYNKQGKLMYSGRIDNWAYELGKKRKVITEHNLKDAIEAMLNHGKLRVTKTKAVGCFIED